MISRINVEPDEGLYLMASRELGHGRHLYSDFPYAYPPLVPYVYGTWMRIFGFTWMSARALSVVMAIVLGMLVYTYAARKSTPAGGFFATFLYSSSMLAILSFVQVKALLPGALLSFAALSVATSSASVRSRAVWSAVLAGLACNARPNMALLIPVVVAIVLRRSERDERATAGWCLGLGLVAGGLLPNIPFLIADPARQWFNIIGAQTHRAEGGPFGSLALKREAIHNVLQFGLRVSAGLQLLLLIAANVGHAAMRLTRRRAPDAVVAAGAALALASLLPNPVYITYFSVVVPFMAVGTLLFLRDAAAIWRRSRLMPALATTVAAAYLLIFLTDRSGFVFPGQRSPVRLSSVLAVSRAIDARTSVGEPILALYDGYLFQTHARAIHEVENQTAWSQGVALGLDPDHRRRYLIRTHEEVRAFIRSGLARIVVEAKGFPWLYQGELDAFDNALIEGGYKAVLSIDGATIYERTQ